MSVVNIQDAYARALIVDRDALRAASASGDVLAGHQVLLDAYNTDVRPLCASARAGARRRRRPGGGAARVRARRAHRRRARGAGGRAMSATTELIASADDLWPADGAAPGDPLDAARARVQPAGRRPRRLELRRRQHLGQGHGRRPHGRRALGDVGQGLGQRSRDDGPAGLHRAAPAGGAAADRARRDERRGDGRPPRALPARSRHAAPVDRDAAARVRAGGARPPHAPRRHQHPRRLGRRRAARARVLRRLGGLDPVHPPRLHALEAGRRGRARHARPAARRAREARARGLGRHGRGGLPRDDRGDQPGDRVRQRAHAGRRRFDGPPGAALDDATRARDAHAAAARDPRRHLVGAREAALRRRVAARRSSSSRSRAAPELVEVGAPVPRSSRAHQARAAVGAVRPRG